MLAMYSGLRNRPPFTETFDVLGRHSLFDSLITLQAVDCGSVLTFEPGNGLQQVG